MGGQARKIAQKLGIFLYGLFRELLPFPRRCRQVDRPVGGGEPKRVRGKAERESRHGRMEHAVDGARRLGLFVAFKGRTPFLRFGRERGFLIEPIEPAQGKHGSQQPGGDVVEPGQRRGFGFRLFTRPYLIPWR